MDITSLYYFVETAKDLHITKTADRLYLSQQTLSNHIQRLEEYFGVPLLYRKPVLSLTCAGEYVLEFCKTVERENINLQDILTDIEHQEKGFLRVGASLARAKYCLPRVLPEFSARYPNVEIRYTDALSSKLEPMILNGELDFAIVLSDSTNPSLIRHELLRDQVYLFVSDRLLDTYYQEGKEALKEQALNGAHVEHFARLPFALPDNRLGETIRACFNEAGFTPRTYMRSSHSSLVLPLCSMGLAACFITHMCLVDWKEQIAEDVNIFPLYLGEQSLSQNISLIYRKDRYLSHYSNYFMEILFRLFADTEQIKLIHKV